jgi:hypothetical protein
MVLQAKPVHPPSRSPRWGDPAAGTPRTRRRDHARQGTERSRQPTQPPSARPAQPLSPRPSPAAPRASLPDRGMRVLLVFTGAMLIMVAAATLVGAVGQWWVLAPVMLVDFILTFIVLALFVELLREGA